MHWFDEWISRGIWAALGGLFGVISTFWLNWRKDKREDKHAEIDGMQAAVAMLTGLTEELRDEVSRLRERQKASEEAEEVCKRNLRKVREDLHTMANALQTAGVTLPQMQAWSPAGD